MSFIFTDPTLHELASRSISFESWQAFVAELAKRDLPACYKPIRPKSLDEFRASATLIVGMDVLRQILESGSTEVLENALRMTRKALADGGEITIYQLIELSPSLILS